MRNYAELLEDVLCWDETSQMLFECGFPPDDRILQNRDELIRFCEWIEEQDIRSYLEIGIWTGRLFCALHRMFGFDPAAACDPLWARSLGLPVRLPKGVKLHRGMSDSESYIEFRRALGHIDLVMIDGDHDYDAVSRDFEINRAMPHRFLAFHDIVGSNQTEGVRRFWEELDFGHKMEICLPHTELGLDHSKMGIGIWWE